MDELKARADAKAKTLEDYARAFRTIVAAVAGIQIGGRGAAGTPIKRGGATLTQ